MGEDEKKKGKVFNQEHFFIVIRFISPCNKKRGGKFSPQQLLRRVVVQVGGNVEKIQDFFLCYFVFILFFLLMFIGIMDECIIIEVI